MRRIHWFEFGDLEWFPQVLREAETAFLSVSYRALPWLYRRWADHISTALRSTGASEILDLCSGSGGAMPMILDELEKRGQRVWAILTDLYPSPQTAGHERITWLSRPIDATQVPPDLSGVRTMFSAFHHFRPNAARAILKNAFDARRAICIFESGPGFNLGVWSPLVVAMMLGLPVHVFLFMPFARPFRWAYLVFTFLIPILPVILLWDSFVSNLRVYSPAQMMLLTEDLQAPDYTWEIGRVALIGSTISAPYLIGKPAAVYPASR